MRPGAKLIEPYFQTKYCYLITDMGKPLGEVFVLAKEHISTTSSPRSWLRCDRRKAE